MSAKTTMTIVGASLLGVGLIGVVICGGILRNSAEPSIPFVVMAVLYAVGAMGLMQLAGALTSERGAETTDVTTGRRGLSDENVAGTHVGPSARVQYSREVRISTDSPLPAILATVSAVGLLALTVLWA